MLQWSWFQAFTFSGCGDTISKRAPASSNAFLGEVSSTSSKPFSVRMATRFPFTSRGIKNYLGMQEVQKPNQAVFCRFIKKLCSFRLMKLFQILIAALFVLIACNRNPYAETNRSYKKQVKALTKSLRKQPEQNSNGASYWVGTT